MLVLDFLLLVMIGISIVYSWTLNRRIQDLQNSRIEFARMIKELNVSITKAETSVGELRELGKVTSSELKVSIEAAKNTAGELMMMNDISNNLADVLSERIFVIKEEQKTMRSSNNTSDSKNKLKNQDFFEEDDIIIDDVGEMPKYTGHLKNFMHNVSKSSEDAVNLNQTNYYNTLRKISAKK